MNICYYEYTFKHLGEDKHIYKHIYLFVFSTYVFYNILYVTKYLKKIYYISLYYKTLM